MTDWEMLENHFSDLDFDEKSHTYTLNGIGLPSVTTIMKPLSDSKYLTVRTDVLDNAANKGSIVHNAIENYLKFGIEDISEEYKPYFLAFLEFLSDKQPTILATETKVYHKFLRYAGTVDLVCIIDGKVYLIDYKTTAVLIKMLTKVQLEAYAKALDSHDFKVDTKAILHLKKDGTYKFEEEENNDSESWTVFGCLLTVNSYINKHKKGEK